MKFNRHPLRLAAITSDGIRVLSVAIWTYSENEKIQNSEYWKTMQFMTPLPISQCKLDQRKTKNKSIKMLIFSHCHLVLMLMFLTPTEQFYLARVRVIRKLEEKWALSSFLLWFRQACDSAHGYDFCHRWKKDFRFNWQPNYTVHTEI